MKGEEGLYKVSIFKPLQVKKLGFPHSLFFFSFSFDKIDSTNIFNSMLFTWENSN